MGELRSTLRLMSCTPWQSLQLGATMSPFTSSAFPWMLSWYWEATCGYFILYSSVRFLFAWHFAQVRERFIL